MVRVKRRERKENLPGPITTSIIMAPHMNVNFGAWQVGARHSIRSNQGPYTTPEKSNFREYFDGVVGHPMLFLSQISMYRRGDSNVSALGERGGKIIA